MTTPPDPFAPPPVGEPSGYPTSPPYGAPQPPPYGQSLPYGQPTGQPQRLPYGTPLPKGDLNGLGVTALVLGLLASVTFWTILGGVVFGVVAVILGFVGRARAKRGQATNGGVALAGVLTGALGIALSVGSVIVFFTSDAGRDLMDCLDAANGDQAAVEQCRTDLERRFGG